MPYNNWIIESTKKKRFFPPLSPIAPPIPIMAPIWTKRGLAGAKAPSVATRPVETPMMPKALPRRAVF